MAFVTLDFSHDSCNTLTRKHAPTNYFNNKLLINDITLLIISYYERVIQSMTNVSKDLF